MIEFKNVSKVFNTNNVKFEAIKNVNMKIKTGKIFGMIGYSGAGKTTLIRMINGLEVPTKGQITINNKDISNYSKEDLRLRRQKIGMIFQHFNLLWSKTVLQNIIFPMQIAGINKNEQIKKAQKLIELVGLNGKEDMYPAELSGGQKQRVGIARALANDPDILLSDEATSALDPKTTVEILNLLADINKRMNITIVLITHEMNVISTICDEVAVLDKGVIVESGLVSEVFKKPQAKITKQFIATENDFNSISNQNGISELLEQRPKLIVYRLVFSGKQTNEPVISNLVHKLENVDINILSGNLNHTREGLIGTLFLEIKGPDEQVKTAIDELEKKGIQVEVLSNEN